MRSHPWPRFLLALLFSLTFPLLLSCESSVDEASVESQPPEGGEPPEQGDGFISYHRDIKPLLDTYCTRCHSSGEIRESVPLTTHEEVQALAPLIKQKVTAREMPPWLAGEGCRDYWFDERLSEEHIAMIAAWADDGAPAGDPNVLPNAPPDVVFSEMSRTDLTLQMDEPYIPKDFPDDYRCFVLDWPLEEPTFVTGFRANPGNATIVHHMIAYLASPSAATTYDTYDAEEEGPGYTCFGSPGGAGLSGIRWLGGWAPGGKGSDFPENTGMRVEPGSKVILQVHYNVLKDDPAPDLSGFSVKLDDTVAHEALILPWADLDWIIDDTMIIPAGESQVTHGFSYDPTKVPFFGFMGKAITIHSATLHMHELGSGGTISILRQDGSTECLLDIPRWDFGWQRGYGFKEPTILHPGDRLALECHWDNSPDNQVVVDGEKLMPQDVHWGEGTQDEMCLGVFYITPE
jgi:hypothetical protein